MTNEKEFKLRIVPESCIHCKGSGFREWGKVTRFCVCPRGKMEQKAHRRYVLKNHAKGARLDEHKNGR